MSSSLSSVILIGVVWLLIVTTLFVRRQTPVRRTSKALSETRVVHEGGTGITRPRRRPLPAESLYHSDQDATVELVEAEPEQVVIDDTRDEAVPAVIDGDVVTYRSLDDHDTGEFAPVRAGSVPDTTVAEDREVSFRGEGEDTVAGDNVTAGTEVDGAAPDETVVVAEPDGADVRDTDGAAVVDGDVEGADHTVEVPEVTDRAAASAGSGARFSSIDVAYIRGGDIDVSVGTDDDPLPVGSDGDHRDRTGVGGDSGAADTGRVHGSGDVSDEELYGGPDDELGAEELTEDDLDFVASRRGRGIYDPVASRELAEQRGRRRRAVLVGLAVVTLLSLVGAVVVSGALWTVVAATVTLTGVYLYSLRRQTVAERSLERRRLARMRRARLGVRNAEDPELGVPDRLRRPGAVIIETDDSDPELAELGYADVTFADTSEWDGRDGADSAVIRTAGAGTDGLLSVRVV